jgi:hypothetical protein
MKNAVLFLFLTSFSLGVGNALAQNMAQSTSATGNWIISETTSPVDYSPVLVATTRSRESTKNSAMELSIYCRNGRTYVVLTGQPISGRAEDRTISYRINGEKPVQAGVGSALFGGVALQGDVVSLLQSLPDEGEVAIRLAVRADSAREAYFSLDGLSAVRNKLVAACKWPRANIKPRS